MASTRFAQLLFVAGSAAFAGCLAVENRLLYYPAPATEDVAQLPAPLQDVTLALADGAKIHARWAPNPRSNGAILFCHGNAGNLEQRGRLVKEMFDALGESILIFDYPGYGRSDGKPSEAGCYASADAAYDWLTRVQKVAPERIVIAGESLGGGVAVDLASRVPVGGMILQCTFSSIAPMARRAVPFLPVGWFMKSKFASIDKIGRVRAPKLHFHGEADDIVPYALGLDLFNAAPEPKRWVNYPELTHNEWPGRRADEWYAEVSAFVKAVAR